MNTLRMKLVFRLGEVGFSIAIEETVEILEALPGWLNRECAAPPLFLLGEMIHRGTKVPVRDLRRRMQLSHKSSTTDTAVVVLGADSGYFALTVDQIDGIFPDAEFATFPVPFQFVDGGAPAYERVDIWCDEPLVALDARTLAASWEP
jgi:chemotaxis signal transduction protein